MKIKYLITLVSLLSVSVINVSAQYKNGLQDESQRIRHGVSSGELTAKEAYRLNNQKSRLKNDAFRYKANDGCIDRRERASLKRDNKRLNANICRQKHDRNNRGRG